MTFTTRKMLTLLTMGMCVVAMLTGSLMYSNPGLGIFACALALAMHSVLSMRDE